MIAPFRQPVHKKTIKLLPQEKEGIYKFDGRFVATRNAIAKFGDAAVAAGELTKEQIDEVAEGVVGAEGSAKREDIKAVVAKARA